MKKLIFIIIIIAFVILIISIFFNEKEKSNNFLLERGLKAAEAMTLRNLPSTFSPDSVKILFRSTINKIRTGNIDRLEFKKFLSNFRVYLKDNKLDSIEVKNLLKELNKLNGSVTKE